jgi:hypothetical protein
LKNLSEQEIENASLNIIDSLSESISDKDVLDRINDAWVVAKTEGKDIEAESPYVEEIRENLFSQLLCAGLLFGHGSAKYGKSSLASIALSFFMAGYSTAHLKSVSMDMKDGLKRWETDWARMKGTHKQQDYGRALKELAQIIATDKWANDDDKSIRLGDMCQLVWNEMAPYFVLGDETSPWHKAFPNASLGFKPWLRDVAPEYARKGGPPKK